jgi:F-type H+-transporting ATPase subunit delta
MRFSLQQYAAALYESLHEVSSNDHDKVIANFIEILKSNGDLREYEKIIDTFEAYDREQKGIKQVELTTAHPVEANRTIIHELNQIVGKDIELKQKVDERLIGGVVVKVDDTMIDGSVKGQLNKLKKNLTQ